MKTITLHGKHIISIVLAVSLLALIVFALESGQEPQVFGHTTSEIDFTITIQSNSQSCAMASFEIIPNSDGSTYCSLTNWDDDSSSALTVKECEVRRRSDGFWEYRFANGCGDTTCALRCITYE